MISTPMRSARNRRRGLLGHRAFTAVTLRSIASHVLRATCFPAFLPSMAGTPGSTKTHWCAKSQHFWTDSMDSGVPLLNPRGSSARFPGFSIYLDSRRAPKSASSIQPCSSGTLYVTLGMRIHEQVERENTSKTQTQVELRSDASHQWDKNPTIKISTKRSVKVSVRGLRPGETPVVDVARKPSVSEGAAWPVRAPTRLTGSCMLPSGGDP